MHSLNLAIWLPALFLLGVGLIALMFVFVAACERV